MKPSTNELLLALRAPSSGWLATLVCALDEALRDPDFSEPQQRLLAGLLGAGKVPEAVAKAAGERMERFEQSVGDLHLLLLDLAEELPVTAVQRPKLTVCGGAA